MMNTRERRLLQPMKLFKSNNMKEVLSSTKTSRLKYATLETVAGLIIISRKESKLGSTEDLKLCSALIMTLQLICGASLV